jgi:hypothetical protein
MRQEWVQGAVRALGPARWFLTGKRARKVFEGMGFDRGPRGERGGRGRDKREGFGEDNYSGGFAGSGGGDRSAAAVAAAMAAAAAATGSRRRRW